MPDSTPNKGREVLRRAGVQVTARERELERLHLLRTLNMPMTAAELVEHANVECDHDAFDTLPPVSARGIGAKLLSMRKVGLVERTPPAYDGDAATWCRTKEGARVAIEGVIAWEIDENGLVQIAVDEFYGAIDAGTQPAEAMKSALVAVLVAREREPW